MNAMCVCVWVGSRSDLESSAKKDRYFGSKAHSLH